MSSDAPPPRHTNRLARSTSPYLLQHAHNPVDWYPWGEEALQRARDEDKPILLSIGYSACHWCHVMERESFENEDIAAQMNAGFVCIKVDREERPDLDEIYMAATQAMNHGQGGWPMTVFLTPEKEPFFTGTYFPPRDAYGRPGFPTVLARLSELWKTQRERVREQAAEVADYLRGSVAPTPGTSLGEEELKEALRQYARDFDETHGGFGGAPKFPPSLGLMLLLRLHRRFDDGHALEMVKATLDGMAMGGMYDQVGGGFHRYSVDAHWLVPHFEKMLYDNALLARAYLEGFQATGDPFYARIAREVLDYVLREMTAPEGGFYSATDADSEGEEGRFFVWTPAQVEEALGDAEAARRFCAYYDISPQGNWEGHSIPNVTGTGTHVAASLGLTPEQLEEAVARARERVYEARARRVPPALDDKVLTAWNALMIGALAEAFRVLGEPRYLAAARSAARFALGSLRRPDGRLLRTWRAGRAHLPAYLEDYAFLCDALVDVYEAGGDALLLREAETLAGAMRLLFADPQGGFFSTASDHEALILRHREGNDGAVPSANATAARALARLSFHLDRPEWREDAEHALRAWGRSIERHPRGFSSSLMTVEMLMEGPIELAFVGPEGPGMEALRREVARHYIPSRIVGHHDPATGESDLPLLRGKTTVDGKPALYVCRDFACQRPVTDPAGVAEALDVVDSVARPTALPAPRIPGAATAEGTRRYAARFPRAAGGFRALGSTDLTVSAIGFGGYRVDEGVARHEEALRRALRSGCNLVDTSTNYADGGSERLVGQVLAQLVREGALARDEVVVVSKIGYLQGRNLEAAAELERKDEPFPEVVKYAEDVWHCLHPRFLADQLTRSLDRLGLEALDVCLLHNPEYFLKDAHERSAGAPEKRRQEFQRRVTQAFAHLESEVANGRIRRYGVSSNTVVAPAGDPEGTSLSRFVEAAQAAGGNGHHFRVLQLPLNIFESQAARVPNTGVDDALTPLALAVGRRIAVLANRPLNAIQEGVMLRLAHPEVPDAPEVEAQALKVEALEREFQEEIGSRLRTAEGSVAPADLFRWAEDLRAASSQVKTLEHWDQLEHQRIMPRLVEVLQALDRGLSGPVGESWHAWRDRYLPELHLLFTACRRRAALRSHEAAAQVSDRLAPLLPPERRSERLSRLALWVVASTPGVSTVLVGMRHPDYVTDALAVMEWPPLPDALNVYDAFAEER